jgi:hypothetical protein
MDLKNQLINYWSHKGHTFGQCFINRELDLMYVNIPKNASMFVRSNLPSIDKWAWENYYLTTRTNKILAVLRDPIERWLSGLGKIYYHTDYKESDMSNSCLLLLFDKVGIDDHTERQVLFLNDLDINKCIFFKFDDNLRYNISGFFKTEFNIDHDLTLLQKINASSEDIRKENIKNIFKKFINKNSWFKNKLLMYYEEDYKLLAQVTYYEYR